MYWLPCQSFFLNYKVSRTVIKNLRWQIGEEITQITLENLWHRWSKTLRKNVNKLIGSQYPFAQISFFTFLLKVLNWQCHKGYSSNFSTELSSQIFDCCPRNFLIQEERIGNVVSTSNWIRPVYWRDLASLDTHLPHLQVHLPEPHICYSEKLKVLFMHHLDLDDLFRSKEHTHTMIFKTQTYKQILIDESTKQVSVRFRSVFLEGNNLSLILLLVHIHPVLTIVVR